MRRLLAIAVAVAVATSSVAFATSVDCPTIRARSRCCCPAAGQNQPRLTCCKDAGRSTVVSSTPRAQVERSQLAPCLTVVALAAPDAGLHASASFLTRSLPASTAGPPLVPLRI